MGCLCPTFGEEPLVSRPIIYLEPSLIPHRAAGLPRPRPCQTRLKVTRTLAGVSYTQGGNPIMKAWSVISLLFAAAILATIPISPQVTPRGLELRVDEAGAVTYGHYRRVHRRVYRRSYRYARGAYRRAYYSGAPSYYYSAPGYYGRRYW